MLSVNVNALVLDLNAFYDTKTLTTATQETGNKMLLDVTVAMDVLKKPRLVLGWSYGIFSTTDTTTTTTTITTSDMGPRFGWFIDKDEKWSFFVTYNLLASATYTPGGSTASTLRGTSIKADVGWTLPVSDNFFCGIKLNYYSATYAESLVGGSTFTQISYARSFIYPSVVFSYRM